MSGERPRRICVITGSRADYGLLSPLIDAISRDKDFTLTLVATGSHLSPEFGTTIREIEQSGVRVDDTVECLLSSDTEAGAVKSTGLGMIGFADVLRRREPDLLILLGDRFEIFAAAAASMLLGIPIAHLHGGEVTEGAVDDSIRHAITKMSHLHFVSTEEYRRRVIQLGEQPSTVYNVGAVGLDRIAGQVFMEERALKAELGLPSGMPVILVTFHPATNEPAASMETAGELMEALGRFPDHCIAATKANADPQGRLLNERWEEFTRAGRNRFLFDSLGSRRYLSLARRAAAVVGNSSSGIMEMPFLGVPSVDIGDRQKGRVMPESVIHVERGAREIEEGIRRALSAERGAGMGMKNPYYRGGAVRLIMDVLRKTPNVDRAKKFFNIHTET